MRRREPRREAILLAAAGHHEHNVESTRYRKLPFSILTAVCGTVVRSCSLTGSVKVTLMELSNGQFHVRIGCIGLARGPGASL